MLSLHTKRKRALSILLGLAVIVPAASVAVGGLISKENTSAIDYPIPAGFYDQNFANCVTQEYIDKHGSSSVLSTGLTDEQLASIEKIYCNGYNTSEDKKISDTTGLNKMPNLKSLELNIERISHIDLSQNRALESLWLNSNPLTNIDLSNNTALEELHLDDVSLASLDLSNNIALKKLSLSHNNYDSTGINYVDVTHNEALEELDIYYKYLNRVDLSYNTRLKKVSISFASNISTVDLSHNPDLESVTLNSVGLRSLDISNNPKLEYLYLAQNSISNIDVSKNTALKTLNLDYNFDYNSQYATITSVDVSKNTELRQLSINQSFDNRGSISSIDLSNNKKLEWLELSNNFSLNTLDVSNNPEIYYLHFNNNPKLYALIPSTIGDGVVEYDLSGLKFATDYTIDTTANYVYDNNSKKIRVTNMGAFNGTVPFTSSYNNHGGPTAKFQLPTTPFSLSFDYNGGGGNLQTQYCYPNKVSGGTCEVTIPSDQPTKGNLVFLGWAEEGVSSVQYEPGQQITINSNKTIHAIWQVNISLFFEKNGGTGEIAMQQCTVVEGDSCKITIPDITLTKDGYFFLGWAESGATTASYQPGANLNLSQNKTLYAAWAIERSLSFDLNGGTGTVGTQKCHADNTFDSATCSVTIPSDQPTKSGFGFVGWSSGSFINHPGELIILDSNVTYTAVWEELKTFTLSFDGNGGTSSINPVSCTTHESNCVIAVPDTVPTRDGYGFAGWAYDRNAEQADYGPGARFAISKDETVYALWTQEEHVFAIFFDSNTVDSDTESVICNTMELYCRVAPPDSLTIREGYTFLGWASTPDATAVEYLPGENIPTSSTLIDRKMMYAIWREDVEPEDPTPRAYHLLFANLDGDGRVNLDIPGYDCTLNGDSDTCTVQIEDEHFGYTLDGYYLLGFADTKNATTATYKLSGNKSVTLDSNEKFIYAVWAPVYTLTLDLHGGAGNIETSKTCHPNSINGDCDVIIPSDSPTKNGYSFLGYADAADSTTATYEAGGNLSLSSNKIIYAIWKEKSTPDDPTPDDPTPDDPTPDDPTPDDPTPDDPTPDGTGDVTWQQGQEYTKESSKNIVFRVDYPMNKFVSLSIDNSSVDKKYYGITSGSTIVTIDHGYLDTLEVGEHTIGVIFADKTITTNFSIIKAEVLDDSTSDDEEDVLVPDTGMFTSGIGGAVATIAIVTFIGLSTAGIMHHIKKRKSEHFVFDK